MPAGRGNPHPILPKPNQTHTLFTGVPSSAWEKAEDKEMEQIIPLYGKTYHMWQVDRGDKVPMGKPELMGSFTSDETVKAAVPDGVDGLRKKTYDRFGISSADKEARRKGLCPGFTVHAGMFCFLWWSFGTCVVLGVDGMGRAN